MPNPIAFLALAIFPVVVVALYGRLRADRALIWALMLGYLFLPEPPAVFDLPLMPPLNKHNIPALMAFMIALWRYGYDGPLLPHSHVGKLLLIAFVFSPVVTVLNNEEAIFFGQVGVEGHNLKHALALPIEQFLLIVPFLMARQHLANGGAQREILWALMVGGLVYSLLMLIEIRLSPQLNLWVYGYYQHLFGQSIRAGGYRPVVFLYHGLWVAFFVMTSVISAYALWRSEKGPRFKFLLAALYLSAVLVLAKSLGALLFMLLLVPLVVVLSPGAQVRVAIVIGTIALAYPILKGADLIPQERMLAQAAAIDPQRAGSLEFRFDNENTLLERAYIKPVFGWGSFGRNHILDPNTGNILTVTDGRWIIVIGVYGWVGFIAEFGLLLLPLLLLGREMSATGNREISPYVGAMSLLLAINALDMIPNATLTPLTWVLVGALTGYAEKLRAERLNLTKHNTALKWQSVM
ncbi:MAG: hypothetical protein ACRBB0_02225 [Pelagimonas sp.]|uniref:hypothetical protein n=1 Tax=Pelagimonas sp. TaxID=2073170 RepID=UPI003D6A81AE